MNKVQLIGNITEIHFDDLNGITNAEFTLVYKQKDTQHFFRCIAKGKCADLLSKMYFKDIEVDIEGKLLNKQNLLSVGIVLELEILITDILFLTVRI